MKRVWLCADFLMTKESEQESNLKWIYDLLGRPIKESYKKANIFVSNEGVGFSREKFFKLSNIDINYSDTQSYYNEKDVRDESLNYLKNFLGEDDILIGYELSEQTRGLLSKIGVEWIDIWLHPIRFMDDVLFGFYSSNEDVNNQTRMFALEKEKFFIHADRLKIQNYRGFRRFNEQVEDNAALFVGQTLMDKAVCNDGKMLNLLDFKERFNELTKKYSKVYYSRHPHVKSGDEQILEYLKSVNNVELTELPAYNLMASGKIKKVVSISSSVVAEAQFFGLETEYYFKPIVHIEDLGGKYVSIYQDLVTSYFWSKLLSPLVETNNCEKINLDYGKDKIRDMLSFYWSYRYVDKTETIRENVGKLTKRVAQLESGKKVGTPIENIQKNKSLVGSNFEDQDKKFRGLLLDNYREIISGGIETVSFDIFDTLIQRYCGRPRDVFHLMERKVGIITEGRVKNFTDIRIMSEKEAREIMLEKHDRDEVLIEEIYQYMVLLGVIKEEHVEKLVQLELETELSMLHLRPLGKKLLDEAKSLNKRVILVSDMYYCEEDIRKILSNCKVEGFDKIYLSSNYGRRKNDGRLFDIVLKEEALSPNKILHIGDNKIGDVESPISRGIKTIYFPKCQEIMLEKSGFNKIYGNKESKNGRKLFDSFALGLIGSRNFSDISKIYYENSMFSGEAFQLGYSGMGSGMLSFAMWLNKEASKNGVSDLYFLARDGKIIKRVYDVLFPNSEIKTHYLHASRSVTLRSSIINASDIYALCKVATKDRTLKDFIETKFGVEYSNFEWMFREVDFNKDDISGKIINEKVIPILMRNHMEIIRIMVEQRDIYERYLKQEGFFDSRNPYVVDVGYAGTIQQALSRLTNKIVGGLYMFTYVGAERPYMNGLPIMSYMEEYIDKKNDQSIFGALNLCFEAILTSSEGELLGFKLEENKYVPIRDGSNKEKRDLVIEKIHNGVEVFALDFKKAYGEELMFLPIASKDSFKSLVHYFKHPNIQDIKILEGVEFDDNFVGQSLRYIVATKEEIKRSEYISKTKSMWKEGYEVLRRHHNKEVLRALDNKDYIDLYSYVEKIEKSKMVRKLKKLIRRPKNFFLDSQYRMLREIGRKMK